jgi:uncharacterized membrane protein YcaP (DUF421 family)
VDLIVRAAVAFVFVFFLTRVIGRRELSSLEPLDLILLVVLGDLIQQGVTQNDYSVTGLALVAATFSLMQVLASYLHFRFPKLRPALDGEPIVLVEDGKLLEQNLKRERLTADDVLEQARQQQLASLDEVQWAIFETNGQISFIPKK